MKNILFLFAFLFIACNPNRPPTTIDGFEAITIQEGEHQSKPWALDIGSNEPSYMWRFNQSAAYCINEDCSWSGDQKDWNKLIGLSFNLFSNHINSAMVGWRWNTDIEQMELNAYFHINEGVQYTEPLLTVSIDQNFQAWVEELPDGRVMVYIKSEANAEKGFTEQEGKYIAEFQRQDLADRTRKIYTWFGGNKPAPNTIIIYRKFITN